MSCEGNMPSFKYVTVANLVITYNSNPYPIKTFVTNKKYIVWNIDRPYQLEDTNVRPESSLLEYLIVINDNGKPTIVEHEGLLYSFDQTTNGSNLTSSSEYNTLKSEVNNTTKKFNLLSNTVDGMSGIIGTTEELKDGSIIYNLNKVKVDSEQYGVKIKEIETKIDDKYKDIKPIILQDLVEYLRSVSEYKLSFTNLLEDTLITAEELKLINDNKTNITSKLTKLQSTLSDLKIIVDEIKDTEKSKLVTDMKNKLSTLHNVLISLCDSYLQDSKISGEEKTNIIQKTYELTTYIDTVQNTCNNITVNSQAGVVYSIENELLMLKDKTTSSIKELDRSNDLLTENYSKLEQTSSEISGRVDEVKTQITNKSNQDNKNIRCNNLGAKINYSTFNTSSNGKIYLHGYDLNNNPTDTNGIIYWNGAEVSMTKGMINPNVDFGTNDCYLCTDLYGGTFVAYYNEGWKYKWLIGSTTSGNLNIDYNYIAFGQFKMNNSESFQYAHLYSSPMKLENALGISNIETRIKTAESKLTADGLTTIIGNKYTTSIDVNGILSKGEYQTASQVQQTVDKFEVKFSENGGYNLLYNGNFKRGYDVWDTANSSKIYFVESGLSSKDGSGIRFIGELDTNIMMSQIVDVKSSLETFTLSYYTYVDDDTTQKDGSINPYRKCEVRLEYIDETFSYHAASDVEKFRTWEKKVITITPQKRVKAIRVALYNRDTTRTVYYNSVQLEKGRIATEFTSNPNEIYAGVTTIDKDGIVVKNGSLTIKNNNGAKVFYGDTNGNLTIDGTIKTTSGSIGGFSIKDGSIYGNNVGVGVSGKEYAFWAGGNTSSAAPFRVGHSGTVTATNLIINNGGIRVYNNSGSSVLYGDSSGNLVLNGGLTSYATITGGALRSTNGNMYFDMNGGTMALYDGGVKIGITNKITLSGTSTPGLAHCAEYGYFSGLGAKTGSSSNYELMLAASSKQIGSMDSGLNLGYDLNTNGWNIYMKSSFLRWNRNNSAYESIMSDTSDNYMGIFGNDGTYIGYRSNSTSVYALAIRENGNNFIPNSLNVFDNDTISNNSQVIDIATPINMMGQSINQCLNIETLGINIIEPIAFSSTDTTTVSYSVTKNTQNIVEFIGTTQIVNGIATVELPKDISFKFYMVVLSPIGENMKVSLVEKSEDSFVIVGDDCTVDYIIKFEGMSYSKYMSSSFSDIQNVVDFGDDDKYKPKELIGLMEDNENIIDINVEKEI